MIQKRKRKDSRDRRHVYFVDEHNSSLHNGIGTYRDALLPLLGRHPNISLTLISLNSATDSLQRRERPFGVEMEIPFVDRGNWRSNGDIIWPLLRQYIADSEHNVFMFNHSPAADFIGAMKQMFPLSRTMFVIHDQGWCASLFGNPGLLAAIEHGEQPDGLTEKLCAGVRSYCACEREIYDIVDHVVCLSESTQRILKDIYKTPDSKVVRIENGFATDRRGAPTRAAARRRLGLRADEELAVFVARAVPHKGILALLRALKHVCAHRPGLRCALMGDPAGFVKYWELTEGFAPRMILAGEKTAEELRRWYAAANVGVLSSYTEQCSYAALEMMRAGLPIVTSDGNGLRDMFTDGRDACVARIGDLADSEGYVSRLASQIERALNASPAASRRMTAAARARLRSNYSATNMANRYAELIMENGEWRIENG